MITKELQAQFVKDIRYKSRLSQRKFAKEVGCSGAYIAQVENGETPLSEKVYNLIIERFNDLANDNKDDCILFPVLGEVHASMGYGVTIYDETQTTSYAISSKLASDLGVKPNNADIIFGTGNSMEPTIKGGDALLVDRNRREICDGKIYCIRHDGQLKAKRLQKLSKTKLKVISDNKDYEPIIIDFKQEVDTDFEIIGEIRWCGRIFL